MRRLSPGHSLDKRNDGARKRQLGSDASPLPIPSPQEVMCSSMHTGMVCSYGCFVSSLVWEIKGQSLHLSSGKLEHIHHACTGLMRSGLQVTVPTMSRQDTLLNSRMIPGREPGAIPALLVPDLFPHRAENPWG